MKTHIEKLGDVGIVSVDGYVGPGAAGDLCDLLVEQVRAGQSKLLVELADSCVISRGGVRALVVAAYLMRGGRRPFRIATGDRLEAYLRRVSFNHLLDIDPDRRTALARLSNLRAGPGGVTVEIGPEMVSDVWHSVPRQARRA